MHKTVFPHSALRATFSLGEKAVGLHPATLLPGEKLSPKGTDEGAIVSYHNLGFVSTTRYSRNRTWAISSNSVAWAARCAPSRVMRQKWGVMVKSR